MLCHSTKVNANDPQRSNLESFTTAHLNANFSFLWFGDTHYSPKFGEVLQLGWNTHPDASFFSIVGDLVSDGLNRDQWDALLNYSKETTCRIPLMAVPGNHDNRAGLGAKMYCDLFSYPMKGGQVCLSSDNGTIYAISVGIPNQDQLFPEEPYVQVVNGTGHLYQYVKIDGNTLYFESKNAQGKMIDQFVINK